MYSFSSFGLKERRQNLIITTKGAEAVHKYKQLIDETIETYKFYDSVDAAEPALGVPDGFDVRVQMMEYDQQDYELRVILCVIAENEPSFFSLENWLESYTQSEYYKEARQALAYKTNFTADILKALKQLAAQYK